MGISRGCLSFLINPWDNLIYYQKILLNSLYSALIGLNSLKGKNFEILVKKFQTLLKHNIIFKYIYAQSLKFR